ncbi:GGDEF domain-containing protein [Modestobacter sp. L9-4]|uniref:GGDEF domain-containing protein n=1 Tax=Modestobacter sp. L9-4 TaxID=2851567 RepID=UPI001C772FF9|nr:GGDEF domain-containing protein [Modestobacter sp. L9-4]QXG74555.1 GGDEF domain-containing protein [Modestobacter sp. L9-4]
MTPGARTVDEHLLATARWRLLAVSGTEHAHVFAAELAATGDVLAAAEEPCWRAWTAAFTARAALLAGDREGAADGVTTARAELERCLPTAEHALGLAYLAHLEAVSDRFDAALHLAVDASLLADQVASAAPSRELHQAHLWLSLALTRLDLEELAVDQALAGTRVAAALPDLDDRWQLLRLAAQQHAELAQTVHRRGDLPRSRELAAVALRCATAARELPVEPSDDDQDLLDVVQAWALTLAGRLDDALPPLRRVHRHLATGELRTWLTGYADLVLARLLSQRCAVDLDPDHPQGDEAVQRLVSASGAFAAVGDRRRYRQCLLELGRASAALGATNEALHWLEAYRTETSRTHLYGRELWAEMFVRRSRLREAERQTAVLRRHALEDTLTGLGNRRSAEHRMDDLRIDREPVSLAVVDVDGFKSVNDQNSHLHGDEVLRRVAELLRQHSRTGDEVFRWAGDEFVVVLPDTTQAQAVVAMERLRTAIADADWGDMDVPVRVTVSIGVATAGPGGATGPRSWRELFDSADLHLFGAKSSGRNRVRAALGGTLPPAPVVRPAGSIDELVAEVLSTSPRRPGWAFEDGEVAS